MIKSDKNEKVYVNHGGYYIYFQFCFLYKNEFHTK